MPIDSTGICHHKQGIWIVLTPSSVTTMSTPPRDPRSGTEDNYGDKNKRHRNASHHRNYYTDSNTNRYHTSHHRNDHRNYSDYNNREHIPQCNVNMYIQRRDYYHPTFNQYGASSNNYVRDTNINFPATHDYNRGRGYGDQYTILHVTTLGIKTILVMIRVTTFRILQLILVIITTLRILGATMIKVG